MRINCLGRQWPRGCWKAGSIPNPRWSHRITSWDQPGGWVGTHRRFYGLAASPKGSSLGWFLRHQKKKKKEDLREDQALFSLIEIFAKASYSKETINKDNHFINLQWHQIDKISKAQTNIPINWVFKTYWYSFLSHHMHR